MDTLSQDTLIKKATDIINADWHTQEDVKTLSKIKYFLSLHYKRINILGSAKEGLYNQRRANKSVELQENMAVGKAENEAKKDAENDFGNYREINAEAQWIDKIIKAIEWFIITLQVENKALNNTQF